MSRAARILVGDDDPAEVRILAEGLRRKGHEVYAVESERKCLQAAHGQTPDLVLLSADQRNVNAMGVCRQIKADPGLAHVPVVLFSRSPLTAASRRRALAVGVDDFLLEPKRSAQLLAQVQAILSFHQPWVSSPASRQQYRRLVEILPEAVGLVDATGQLLSVNPQAVKMLGYANTRSLLRRTVYDLTPPEHHTRIRADLATALDAGRLRNTDYAMVRKDGSRFPVEVSARAVRSAPGRASGVLLVVRDVSERQHAEERIGSLLKRAEDEMRLLPRRLIEAQEAERLRVSRDLHDSVNQILAAARMQLRCVEESVAATNPASAEALGRCDELLAQALEESRHIAHNLRPSDLDRVGLAGACQNLCQQFQGRTRLALKVQIGRLNGSLPPAVELNLFRILQEALANAESHANARSIRVSLESQGDIVCLVIQDDGRGFNAAALSAKGELAGLGLTNMRERAAAIGGRLEVVSAPGRGTRITVRVPKVQCAPVLNVPPPPVPRKAEQIHLPLILPPASGLREARAG